MTAIEISGLSVAYLSDDGTPLAPSLGEVELRIAPGECVLITGPSGCGKTSLLRTLIGLVPGFFDAAVTGEILLDGVPVSGHEPRELARTVGMVFQDPRAEFFTYDVTSELAFPCENLAIPGEHIRQRLSETARMLDMGHLLGRRIAELSSGEKQKVAIAAAVMPRPAVLLFDEPSANLDHDGLRMLHELIAVLRAEGITVLVADHRIEYLHGVLDRLVVLDGGRVVHDVPAAELAEREGGWFAERGLRRPCVTAPLAVPLLPRGDGPRLQDVSLHHRGQPALWRADDLALPDHGVIGVAGPNGSGKTSLLRLITGAHRRHSGSIAWDGRAWRRRARMRDCAYVMQDIDYQLLGASVRQELLIGAPQEGATERRAAGLLERMELEHLQGRHPLTLSGGQKQRLGIALAAMKGARVICLDEPTSGLDATNMRRVADLLTDLAVQGALILVATHDDEFAARTVTGWIGIDAGELVPRHPSDLEIHPPLDRKQGTS